MKDLEIPIFTIKSKMADSIIYSTIGIFDLKNKKNPAFS